MPRFNLTSLGPDEFERLVQALLKEVIGSGTITFGIGRDGGREATFEGAAPYPSLAEQWSGRWIFQAKFHDTDLLGVDKARQHVISDAEAELKKLTDVYNIQCDNYVIATNVPLTPVPISGTLDRIENQVFARYRKKIPHLAIWGADDISAMLVKYESVRRTFMHLVVAGDVIALLLRAEEKKKDDVGKTIEAYLATSFTREQYAQLDQAGDVSDTPVRLQKVFFDLSAAIGPANQSYHNRFLAGHAIGSLRSAARITVVQIALDAEFNRIVLVGGPGEGKSTLGQYLAQLHRATLIQRADDIALGPTYIPLVPRLPFRVILRDFGQWLAESPHGEVRPGTLDQYLRDMVVNASGREMDVTTLHKVIAGNPTLLVLDGLDEVTDPTLKTTLLNRIAEFTERCETVLKADLQVLATTRPTGYTEQFDPKDYLHLYLKKLEPAEVKSYVEKWVIAKEFDEAKSGRILSLLDECLTDDHIRLLTRTPLQVTILALIISSGGSPPRQREALFDEYLEVIYKRETAKGKNIIQSEKDRLIGLHKYIGYIVHEQATHAKAMASYLSSESYRECVAAFLHYHDPYSTNTPRRDVELRAITKEAGDRLVLIVEPKSGRFGFELRSIQEFFAACHMVDTSQNSEERYQRFNALARLSHWRNVALFFAGRVGRTAQGEIFNVIEVCRGIDADGPDRFARRGAELALELAADRALGHNRRAQRSLVEVALSILQSSLSHERREYVSSLLHRLPNEDIVDHVIPVLKERSGMLDAQYQEDIAFVAHTFSASDLALTSLHKMLSSDSGRRRVVRLALNAGARPFWKGYREGYPT